MCDPLPEFLSDLGRATVGSSSFDDPASELMRAEGDPLLLRAVLSRKGREWPLQSRPASPELLVALDSASGGRSTAPGRRHFDMEPLISLSLEPERFVPTSEEYGKSVEAGDITAAPDGMARRMFLAVTCAVALVLTIYLLSK